MKNMRILIWNPLLSPGGGTKLLAKLASSLADLPSVSEVGLVLSETEQSLGQWFQNIDKLKMFFIPRHFSYAVFVPFGKDRKSLPYRFTSFLRRLLFSSAEKKDMSNYLAKTIKGYDILYCPWPHQVEFPYVNIPIFCTYQDAILLDFPEILKTRALQEKSRSQEWVRNSTRVIVSSNSTKSALERHFPNINIRFEMIRHAIPPELPQVSIEIRDKWRSLLPETYFVCITNISPHKNLRRLLLVWSQFALREKYPLVLIGYGTQIFMPDWDIKFNAHGQQDELLDIVKRAGLKRGKDIFGFGYVPDIDAAAILNGAIGLIMSSLAEGGGSYPVAEAMSLGIPVMCSNISVMHEQLDSKRGIVWFDPDSVDSMLMAIDYFLKNYLQIKDEFGRNEPEDLTWDDIASQYFEVFSRTKQEIIRKYENTRCSS